jgi:sigma-E factor negative regulatory protein RseC
MITALATVTAVDRQPNGNLLTLSCDQQTSCSHCASQSSCGTGIVSKAVGRKQHQWQLLTQKAVQPGQLVEIGLSERNLVRYASIVYLLPILALASGAAVAELWLAPILGMGEGVTIFIALLSLFAGIAAARAVSRRLQSSSAQSVTLLRVLGGEVKVHSSD